MAEKFYPIETYLRVRPRGASGATTEYAVTAAEMVDGSERGLFDLSIPPDAAPGLVHNNTTGHVEYEFDAIFGEEASQEDVFDIIARDKVDNLLAGENSTIFAYGQTGSGKTYTIFGGDTFSERGLIPRALGLIFRTMAQKQAEGKSNVKLRLSFTEVYGEAVFDLLDPQKRYISMEQWSPVQILEADGELVLRNLNVYEVENEEDALSLFFMGNTNRITSATPMNEASSRSHAIFTVMVEHDLVQENGEIMVCTGKLNLVDLAGSERVYKQKNTKRAQREGKNINLSLHYLEQVIVRLRDLGKGNNGRAVVVEADSSHHIPYRNSVLTSILRDSLGGNCKSAFLLTVSTDRAYFDETVSTCRFGKRCGEVKVKVKRNTALDHESRIRQLEQQIAAMALDQEELVVANEQLKLRTLGTRALDKAELQACRAVVYELLQGAKFMPNEDHAATADRLTVSTEQFTTAMRDMDHAAVLEVLFSLAQQVQRVLVSGPRAHAHRVMTKKELHNCRTVVYDLLQGAKFVSDEDEDAHADRLHKSTEVFTSAMGNMDHAAVLDVSMSLAAQIQRVLIMATMGSVAVPSPSPVRALSPGEGSGEDPEGDKKDKKERKERAQRENKNSHQIQPQPQFQPMAQEESTPEPSSRPQRGAGGGDGGTDGTDVDHSHIDEEPVLSRPPQPVAGSLLARMDAANAINDHDHDDDDDEALNQYMADVSGKAAKVPATFTAPKRAATARERLASRMAKAPAAKAPMVPMAMPAPARQGRQQQQQQQQRVEKKQLDYASLQQSFTLATTPLAAAAAAAVAPKQQDSTSTPAEGGGLTTPSPSGIYGLSVSHHQMLTKGALFLKHGRMGTKARRFVNVSNDLTTINWRTDEDSLNPNSIALTSIQSVSTGVQGKRDRCLVAMVGRPGYRSLFIDFDEEGASAGHKHLMATLWTEALQVLCRHSSGPQVKS